MAANVPLLPHPHADAIDLPLKFALARAAHGISPASLAIAQVDWLAHDWLRQACAPGSGSWWPHWNHWLGEHADGMAAARPAPSVRIAGELLAAPGGYVFQE